jgi:hypothetical protein
LTRKNHSIVKIKRLLPILALGCGTIAAHGQNAARSMPDWLELRLTSSLPMNVEHRFSAHFVPMQQRGE